LVASNGVHFPPLHVLEQPLHTLPHAPQLLTSVCRLTHVASQRVSPVPQVARQVPPVHEPAAFAPVVQAVPSARVVLEQVPLGGSQLATWHESLAGHRTGLDPVQAPAKHA
jgi:hypothetical protein